MSLRSTCRHTLRAATIVLLAVAAAACSTKAKVREPAKLTDIENPRVKVSESWSQSIGNGADGRPSGLRPLLEADALFVADSAGRVSALDPETGRERWKTLLKARISAGPSVVDDLVLVGTLDSDVIALKRADGSLVWRAKVSSEVLAPPAGAGNVVVVRSIDGRSFGLSKADGQRLWSFDRTVPSLTLRGISAPLIEGDRVLLGMDSGRLAAVQLSDGIPLWEQPISVPSGRTELERLADIDAQLVEDLDGVLVASYGGDVTLINPADGESRWRRAIKSGTGMAVGGGTVFVSDVDGVMWALDAATGAAVWKNEALQYRRLSPPAFFKGYAVVADYQGYLHFFDAADGKLVGRTRVGRDPVLAPMVATDTTLYVYNVDGRLEALTLR
ncbi:MAG: outer membrane protein assembly factor BamB [Stagnimonas sp.]|nr:outer membrane protein assembly factor BamB [Stagnimonas sp.]